MNDNENTATLTLTYASWDDHVLAEYAFSHEIEYFDSSRDDLTITLTGQDAIDAVEDFAHLLARPEDFDADQMRPVSFTFTR